MRCFVQWGGQYGESTYVKIEVMVHMRNEERKNQAVA